MIKLQNFIHGEYVPPQSGTYFDNFLPATGEVYSQVPDSNELDVVLAIQSASKAFEKWSEMKVKERSQILYRIADLIESKLEDLALAESRDVGKPLKLARELDIPRAAENFRFFAGRILHHEERATLMDSKALNYTVRSPLGVAGLISPWNLPLYLLTWKIAPALAVGNTAVCKPSEITPMTAFLLGQIFNEAGLPPGVCNIVLGKGDPAGQTLVSHPGVPLISFTGGTATGEKVGVEAAKHFKKMGLELGGKNAAIVLKDADLKRAVSGIVRSSFLNSGQICLCSSKILVQEEIYEQFLEQFKIETEKLKIGDPGQAETTMGPLASKAHLEKVKSAVAQAIKDKAKVVTGGDEPKLDEALKNGYYFKPTILTDLSNCSDLHQTEIFGPVVTVQPFKYPHDAVKWANNSPYGLSASLWTQDLSKAHRIAPQIDAGTVWVNCWLQRDLRMPFGGMKASGLGREGGDDSIDFYTEQKTICIQL